MDASIHHPTDSTLLRDSVRVLVRLMKRARRWVSTRFVNHLRRVSIFEDHADVILKDPRESVYGHKVCLAAGASGLALG